MDTQDTAKAVIDELRRECAALTAEREKLQEQLELHRGFVKTLCESAGYSEFDSPNGVSENIFQRLELLNKLRAERDAALARAEAAERERDALRASCQSLYDRLASYTPHWTKPEKIVVTASIVIQMLADFRAALKDTE